MLLAMMLAPAKPKTPKAATEAKAPAKAKTVKTQAAAAPIATPSHDEIATLARKYWEERGWQDGAAEQDWLRAEQELSAKAS